VTGNAIAKNDLQILTRHRASAWRGRRLYQCHVRLSIDPLLLSFIELHPFPSIYLESASATTIDHGLVLERLESLAKGATSRRAPCFPIAAPSYAQCWGDTIAGVSYAQSRICICSFPTSDERLLGVLVSHQVLKSASTVSYDARTRHICASKIFREQFNTL
jgi:hypothetical protein